MRAVAASAAIPAAWTVAAVGLFVLLVSGPGDIGTSGLNGTGKLSWALADLITLVAILRGGRAIVRMITGNLYLALWPLTAILSGLWSLTPGVSVYHGLQLGMTLLVGYLISQSLGLRRVLLALAIGLALGEVLSIMLLLRHVDGAIGTDGTWIGAYTHKNVLGSMMTLQLITCVCLVLDRRHRLFALACMLPAIALLIGSRSGTSLLSLAVALSVVPLALCYRRSSRMFGVAVGVSMAAAGLLAALVLDNGNLAGLVLGGIGKDDTLTGRTVLWQFGFDQIRSAPLLGIGYKAYWESSTTSSAYLRYVIGQDLWFFHNNFVDVGVAFGAFGLTVFSVGLLSSLWRTLSMFFSQPEACNLWRLLFVLYVIVEATAEDPLFQNHSLHQLLLGVATAWPKGLAQSRALSPPARAGQLYPGGLRA